MTTMDTSSILDRGFNHAVMTMCNLMVPRGFDVIMEGAPETLADVTAYAKSHNGRLGVWGGASDKTIFGDAEVNLMFRAWHDACHIAGQFDFTLEGERKACELQIEQLRNRFAGHADLDKWCALLYIEVIEQAKFFRDFNCFPTDQVAFTTGLLANPEYRPTL